MLHQAKLIKEVVKLDRISIICLVNVNIEVTEKHELFRCCDIQFQVVGEFSDEHVVYEAIVWRRWWFI